MKTKMKKVNDNFVDFDVIPQVELSREQKAECCKVMLRGNEVLKEIFLAAKPAALALKVQNGKKCKYSRSEFRVELFKVLTKNGAKIYGVTITPEQAKKILAVRNIEGAVLAGHSKLISKVAYRWSKAKSNGTLVFGDIYNELVTKAIHAIYCYGKEVEFSTYLVHILNRHMMNVVADDNPLSHWGNNVRKLYGKYRKAEANSVNTSFDDLVVQLGMTKKEITELRHAMATVKRQSELETSQEEGDSVDITGLGRISMQEDRNHPEMSSAIQNVKSHLSEFENAILNAYLTSTSGKTGWQSDVVKKYVNPTTGKAYSRQCVPGVFNRVCAKVKKEYEKVLRNQVQAA